MSNKLFICNTYSQLIEAIQLKLTLFSKDKIFLVISDHTIGLYELYINIKETGLFENVYLVKTKNLFKKNSFKDKVYKLISFVNGKDKIWETLSVKHIDEIIFYSQTDEVYTLFAKLYEFNHNLIVSRYEEGIVSYDDWEIHSVKSIFTYLIRTILKKKSLEQVKTNFYCYYPSLYNGIYNAVNIPLISSNETMPCILNNLFDLKNKNINYDKYKYIFLTSVYDFEGGESIGEIDAVMKVARVVGIENLIVKVHPRDNSERFKKLGLNVDTNSNLPWEAIQLGKNFSNHILITCYSCSALSVSLTQSNPPKIFFVYSLCNFSKNKNACDTIKVIESILSDKIVKSNCPDITIIKSEKELRNIL